MTVTLFIALLTVFATVTSICTEAIKKLLNEFMLSYSSNLLVSIIACVVGIGGTAVYYTLFHMAFTASNIVCMVLMGIATALGAMVGYDKVIQAIKQMQVKKS